jgi:hypothetical protein
MPDINMNTIGALITILFALYGALKAIAPKTATKTDDNAVAMIETAKAWVEKLAPHIWAVVEVLAAEGKLPPGVTKAEEFAKRLIEAQKSPDHVGAAIAAGLSAADKMGRIPTPSPPQGPVSK